MEQASTMGLGINPGHGFVKVALVSDGHVRQTATLPALVVRAQRQVLGALKRIEPVQIGGIAWWIGEDALLSAAACSALTQERLRDAFFIPALVRGALSRLTSNGQSFEQSLADATCVTGLPATWSLDRDLASALVQRLRSAWSLGQIKVIPEPLGLVYSALLNDDGQMVGDDALRTGRVAVIDLGHNTVDVATLNRMVPEPQGLATYQLGTVHPLYAVQQKVTTAFEVEKSLYEIDQATRQGYIKVGGKEEALPRGWDEPLHENGRSVAARLCEAWGRGNQFDAILIGGGGAEMPALVEAIQTRFKHASVVPDGQMAVALGYARLARYLGKRAA